MNSIIVWGEDREKTLNWLKQKYLCTTLENWKDYFQYCLITDKEWRTYLTMPLIVSSKYIFLLDKSFIAKSQRIKCNKEFVIPWGNKEKIFLNLFFKKFARLQN